MSRSPLWLALVLAVGLPGRAFPQFELSGRVVHGSLESGNPPIYLSTVLCFASKRGSEAEALSFRTWETHPVGWYRISGVEGCYTLVFSNPAHYARPRVLTNVHAFRGERIEKSVSPRFDYAVFQDSSWDEDPAVEYFQPFVARSTSITHVGFKLATDGVDGGGPGSQDFLLAVHAVTEGPPESWPQIGPEASVLGVDCGGPKNTTGSAGWSSGEVPTVPGTTYALRLRTRKPRGTFQAFWKPSAAGSRGCWRVDPRGSGEYTAHDLWLALGGDGDGLLIPYPKRVHREFQEFGGFDSRWAQTYVAQGRGLASVILYAAVGGAQPPLSRQRVRVRVREGGPQGPIVGVQKIAIGNGNYTGDASWGTFGASFAPGEVPLVPGTTYAIELESIESYATLHGFVNIKGQVSDDRPGFNPYRKCAPDAYPHGTAYKGGTAPVEFDLDLQVIEYERPASDWAHALEPESHLSNGDMEAGTRDAGQTVSGVPESWTAFSLEGGTVLSRATVAPEGTDAIARVSGAEGGAGKADGGFFQRVPGLRRSETYRLNVSVRCSWPADVDRHCLVGVDPTGQTSDPGAATIDWEVVPSTHGIFVEVTSDPIRPVEDVVSVWLRARSSAATPFTFQADFNDVALRKVATGVPQASGARP